MPDAPDTPPPVASIGDRQFSDWEDFARGAAAESAAHEQRVKASWPGMAAKPRASVPAAPTDPLPADEVLMNTETGLTIGPRLHLPLPLVYELARESEELRSFTAFARKHCWDTLPQPPGGNEFWPLAKVFIHAGFPEAPWMDGPHRWPAGDMNRIWLTLALKNHQTLEAAKTARIPDAQIIFLAGPDADGNVWAGSDGARVGGPAFRFNPSLPDSVLAERFKDALAWLRKELNVPEPRRGRGRPAGSGAAVNDAGRVADALRIVRRSRAGASQAEALGRKVSNPHEAFDAARQLVQSAVETHLDGQIALATGWRDKLEAAGVENN